MLVRPAKRFRLNVCTRGGANRGEYTPRTDLTMPRFVDLWGSRVPRARCPRSARRVRHQGNSSPNRAFLASVRVLKSLLLDENAVPEDDAHRALRCHTQTGSVNRSQNRSRNNWLSFWGEGSLLSGWEHLDNRHRSTVYRYYYRPTTSNIATVKQHKIKNSVANLIHGSETSIPVGSKWGFSVENKFG